ncbi:polysaccharide pyruvyl transferase family protein [Acinetobacter sp. YIM 103518]|uniref:Polysaccharide pyruvyl transferase family protein n=1 Tax=Acinetobacter faecalis TaxID=2665161 RepID=A0A6L6GGN6_9GAMM|nr:polysaccharide pyruvyl transferase family protein [Acinetobacter faecalis]MTD11641.1 polysaccharide pyruvyl transferase family protein [Acinetobacter faecalis]
MSTSNKKVGDSTNLKNTKIKPKIGLTGSFGRGNYGDELYLKNYQYWFGGFADLFLLSGLSRKPYLIDFNKNFVDMMDAVVLGGGDLLVPHKHPIDLDFIDSVYLRKPLHVACIGVQVTRHDKDQRVVTRWQKFLSHENVKTISTRDTGSKAWIEEHIKPSVTINSFPDMVCALPLPPVSKPKDDLILGIVTRHVADPKNYRLLEEIGRELISRGWKVHHIIGGVSGHGKKDFENASFLDIPGKETIYSENLDDISKALGSCTLVLSYKLHTTLVSVMYGVPTICINPVVKAKAFMASAGLENHVFNATDPELKNVVLNSVPSAPDPFKVGKLRDEASTFMKELGAKIYNDFYESQLNSIGLSEKAIFPE